MGSRIGLGAKVHGVWYRICDNLSRYFLCSNDSNGVRMGRKLTRGMGMHGNFVCGDGVCVRLAGPRRVPTGARSSPAQNPTKGKSTPRPRFKERTWGTLRLSRTVQNRLSGRKLLVRSEERRVRKECRS